MIIVNLVGSGIFFERCIDKELGASSIDASIVGTPATRLTHPDIGTSQALNRDELLYGYRFSEP